MFASGTLEMALHALEGRDDGWPAPVGEPRPFDVYDDLEASYPAIRVVRGRRFVEHEHVATAGGSTSGIDLALQAVERYLGRAAADATAEYMEYGGAPCGVPEPRGLD